MLYAGALHRVQYCQLCFATSGQWGLVRHLVYSLFLRSEADHASHWPCRLQHVATQICSHVRLTMEQRAGPTIMWCGPTKWMMQSETTRPSHPLPRVHPPMHPPVRLPALFERQESERVCVLDTIAECKTNQVDCIGHSPGWGPPS